VHVIATDSNITSFSSSSTSSTLSCVFGLINIHVCSRVTLNIHVEHATSAIQALCSERYIAQRRWKRPLSLFAFKYLRSVAEGECADLSIAYYTSELASRHHSPGSDASCRREDAVQRDTQPARRRSAGGIDVLLDVVARRRTSSSSPTWCFEIKIEGGLKRQAPLLWLYAARRFGNPSKISLSRQLPHYETLGGIIYAEVCEGGGSDAAGALPNGLHERVDLDCLPFTVES